jgi:hypothetical protein
LVALFRRRLNKANHFIAREKGFIFLYCSFEPFKKNLFAQNYLRGKAMKGCLHVFPGEQMGSRQNEKAALETRAAFLNRIKQHVLQVQ